MANDQQQKIRETAKTADADGTLTSQALVQKYSRTVLGVCLAYTKNVHDAEDVMQDVFLKACMKLGTLRDRTKARAWLCQIARRACVDYYRKRPSTRMLPDDVPAKPKADNELVTRLHSAICKLPQGHREVITLYYLNGRKCVHIAQALGINEDTVRSRLVRARFALHNLLTEDQS